MVDRLLVDVDASGVVSVSTVLAGGDLPSVVSSGMVVEPALTDDDLKDLQWYLEDYLRAPYGTYAGRGEAIAQRLSAWGQLMFTGLFGAGPARDAYIGLRSRTGSRNAVQIVVRSGSPTWLGLPWELMTDPDRSPAPLVLDGVSVARSLPTPIGAAFDVGGELLRVLMVISRPRGVADVGYRMIARHLVSRLELVAGKVELVVLRPPTVDSLEATLRAAREAGNPFQIVHFDGHGVLTGNHARADGADSYADPNSGVGMLLFEHPGGGDDPVPAERIGRVLADGQVPVVVLNACQSGAVGKQVEATVAPRLLAGGASAVVAMAYSVYAVAAAEFMAAFYERLFSGATITDAVAAGRARIHQRPERPSPRGELPLEDWLIPVHYLRKEIRFPHLHRNPSTRPNGISLSEALDRLHRDTSDTLGQVRPGDALMPVGDFVGRDALFYTLEVAARTQHVVVLHGSGGAGKTELAKAFGRWWQDTHGVDEPKRVIWHSFEPGVASFGLDGVVDAIGMRLWGTEFAHTMHGQRRPLVEDVLQQHRLLLILDNFETVYTMPDPTKATPPLSESGRTELREFLSSIATHGCSTILITSRNTEDWLGPHIRRVSVDGLTPEEADIFTDHLLAPYPAAQLRRAQPAFRDLLRWLDGHPFTMRLTLPHLETTDPDSLLTNLEGRMSDDGEPGSNGDRNRSLAASIDYSFTHLDAADRRLLHVIGLCRGVADANVLALFSNAEHTPERFRDIDTQRWSAVLDHAANVGLLTAIGGLWIIHPALPGQLIRHWRGQYPDSFHTEYVDSQRALLHAHAFFCGFLMDQITTGDAGLAHSLIDRELRNLGYYLGYALEHHEWGPAGAIAQPLLRYWKHSGLTDEAAAWTDRVLDALETSDGTHPPLNQSAGILWLNFTSEHATQQLLRGDIAAAQRALSRVHYAVQQQPETPETQRQLATTNETLGSLALERHDYGEAERLFQQAIAIRKQLGDRDVGLAKSHEELGLIAQKSGDYDRAELLYEEAVAIRRELGNQGGLATTYNRLGTLAHERHRYDDAERWYRESLAIEQHVRNQVGIAGSYQNLGALAQSRGRFKEAEHWYTESLIMWQDIDNRYGIAQIYAGLGTLAIARCNAAHAVEWLVRCVTVFDEFPHSATEPGAQRLADLVAAGLPVSALEQTWAQVTGKTLPQQVRAFVMRGATRRSNE